MDKNELTTVQSRFLNNLIKDLLKKMMLVEFCAAFCHPLKYVRFINKRKHKYRKYCIVLPCSFYQRAVVFPVFLIMIHQRS